MQRSSARLTPAVVLLSVLALSLTGCSLFAPPEGGDPPPTGGGYRERVTCENVVHNLIYSYEQMESEQYIACLDDSFTFVLNEEDVINDPLLPWEWNLDTEAAIARNMLDEGTNIQSIQLTLTQFGEEVEVEGPIPDEPYRWIYIYTVDLWVTLPDDFHYWANAAARFTFAIDDNETGPNGEMLWDILTWEDIEVEARPPVPEGADRISITELKTLFQ